MTWPPVPQPPGGDTCAHCGLPLDDSPFEFWCSAPCQMLWQSKDLHTRITAWDTPPPVPASWPTTAIPHPAGGVTYARSKEEYQRYTAGAGPLPPAPESAYPPDAVALPETKRPGPFRRIVNATRRTT